MASKNPNAKQPRASADPARVAIFSPSRSGASVVGCDGLVASIVGARVECIASESWEGAGCLERAHAWAEEQLASRHVMLLDGAEVISRTMALPAASPDQLDMALRLQVENVLLGGAARWRTAAAILPSSDPDRERTALMVEWPTASNGPALPECFTTAELKYAPPIVALAAIVLGAVARGAHESMCLLLQRGTGGISLAYSNGIKVALRTALEDGSDEAAWKDAVVRTVTESLMMAELPEALVTQVSATVRSAVAQQCDGLVLPQGETWSAISGAATGVGSDQDWRTRFGLPMGCALALAGPMARTLALRLAAETVHESWWLRMLRAMERPTVAAKLGVAALLALALVPMAVARGRLAYLEWRVPDRQTLQAELTREERMREMYAQIPGNAVPMTKLLGDIASCTPEGIEVTSISIDSQGKVTRIDLQADASKSAGKEAFELVIQMQQMLRESKVFEEIEKTLEKPDSSGNVPFRITMRVKDPTRAPNYKEEQDFAKKTLRERRFGPPPADASASSVSGDDAPGDASGALTGRGGSQAPPDAAAAGDSGDSGAMAATAAGAAAAAANASALNPATGDAGASASRRGTSGSGRAPGAARTRERAADAAAPSLPPPLTEGQIASMTKAEAKAALQRISEARNSAGVDEESAIRLKREMEQVLRRLREARE